MFEFVNLVKLVKSCLQLMMPKFNYSARFPGRFARHDTMRNEFIEHLKLQEIAKHGRSVIKSVEKVKEKCPPPFHFFEWDYLDNRLSRLFTESKEKRRDKCPFSSSLPPHPKKMGFPLNGHPKSPFCDIWEKEEEEEEEEGLNGCEKGGGIGMSLYSKQTCVC